MILPKPLQPLAPFNQFITHDNKVPTSPHTGQICDPHDPKNWASYEVANATGRELGFVFTADDPFYFVDLDHCLVNGAWSPVATDIMRLCNGAAVEVSRSGDGLHIFGIGAPPAGHANKNVPLGIELYTHARFAAITGTNAVGSAAHIGADLDTLVSRYFTRDGGPSDPTDWTTEPSDDWDGHTGDDALIEHACSTRSAANAFGDRASFKQLWEADEDALAAAYPDQYADRVYDGSSADAALASHLAFWTGRDCERIDRLMRESALEREKWEREDYLRLTITVACGRCEKVHVKKRVVNEAGEAELGALLNGDDMLRYFKGCVYVREQHRVLIPDGSMLRHDQFKVAYGGRSFMMDYEGGKVSRNAWEAFTESQVYRPEQVIKTMFRPDMTPGDVFNFQGRQCVNNYVPVNTGHAAGDVTPFLNHLAKVVPNERDRSILLCYMAACVQHKGVKFQWTVLVQGVEGNGKTLFSRVVAEAVGMQYTHSPRAAKISADFNSWIKDKIFIYVEDVYLPESKREVLEALKPIVTNDWQAVEPKGVDQTTEYVVANLMLNSNHRDAIKKTRNDRRFSVFYTAQQEYADLERDGMMGDYFPELYNWLKAGGYGHVAQYLGAYAIADEFNPSMCPRAPDTSSTDAAVKESLGGIEQEILEAVEEGRAGFCGGWVSSMALDTLLGQQRAGRMIPPNRRRDLMKGIGYDYHPNLKAGRVNNTVTPDGGKPRLYIRAGHIHMNLNSPAEIARQYSDAQIIQPDKGGAVFTTG